MATALLDLAATVTVDTDIRVGVKNTFVEVALVGPPPIPRSVSSPATAGDSPADFWELIVSTGALLASSLSTLSSSQALHVIESPSLNRPEPQTEMEAERTTTVTFAQHEELALSPRLDSADSSTSASLSEVESELEFASPSLASRTTTCEQASAYNTADSADSETSSMESAAESLNPFFFEAECSPKSPCDGLGCLLDSEALLPTAPPSTPCALGSHAIYDGPITVKNTFVNLTAPSPPSIRRSVTVPALCA